MESLPAYARIVKAAAPFVALIALVGSGMLALSSAHDADPQVASVSAAKLVALTNEARADDGRHALARSALLDRAAQLKAEDMAANGYYAHVSPDGRTPMDFADKAGYRYLMLGENLVVQRTSAEQAIEAFMGSPGHRANILRSDFTEIGIGVANGAYKGQTTTFTVQLFAKPHPSASSVASAVASAPKEATSTRASLPAAMPAVATVPRSPVPVSTVKPDPAAPIYPHDKAVTPSAIAEKNNELMTTLAEGLASLPLSLATTSSAASTSEAVPYAPRFSLSGSVPVLLAVSPSQPETPPVPVGASWNAQLEVWMNSIERSMRAWFTR